MEEAAAPAEGGVDEAPADEAPEGEVPENENPGDEAAGDDITDDEVDFCEDEEDLPNNDQPDGNPSDDASQTTPPETAQPSPETTAPPDTTPSPGPTPAPEKPTYFMQNALPGQYTSAFCRCNTEGGETVTLELLTVENPEVVSESCSYTAMPTETPDNPVSELTPTYTIGCEVCTGPAGAENHDPDWCTPVPGCVPPRPTFALYLSDTSVSLGTAANDDEGVELGKELVNKLKEHCPEDED